MISLGALAFLNPWLLAALASLPLIYWLLRTVPPRPRQIAFPPTRILVGLENKEKTPAKTPWWLLLIRLLAAALVIFALADPVLNPNREQAMQGDGPLVIAVDNGWASAARWTEREAMIERYIASAEQQSRAVIVLPTAFAAQTQTIKIEAPNEARTTAAAITPQPFAPDRDRAAAALQDAVTKAGVTGLGIVWLTDGIDHDAKTSEFAETLSTIVDGGTFAVIADPAGTEPLGLSAQVAIGGKLEATVVRSGGPARTGTLVAYSARSERLGETPFELATDAISTKSAFDLPLELRNQVTRVAISEETAAGAVSLLDSRAQWHRIGLLSGEAQEQSQPLLGPLYYIERALQPYAELVKPTSANLVEGIDTVLEQNSSVLVLADIGTLQGDAEDRVSEWVEKGGVLVRFAGPRLEKGGDELLPVPLRIGGRTLGGALSWSTPQPLAAFEDNSLFAGLPAAPDVTINRQVLADPARMGGNVSVWAHLQDGTPLVTAARRGEGQIVLFHITANADWSSLPMSGLFVDMLRRVASLGRLGGGPGKASDATLADGEASADQAATLPPLQTLDGYGVLKSPPPTAEAIPSANFDTATANLANPPGYYGAGGSPRSLNAVAPGAELKPLPALPSGAEMRGYQAETSTPLKPWLLTIALALILMDVIAVLLLQSGGLFRRNTPVSASASPVIAIISIVFASNGFSTQLVQAEDFSASKKSGDFAQWQPGGFGGGLPPGVTTRRPTGNGATALTGIDETARQATGKVTFGYVLTGNRETDDTSRVGLAGLARVLAIRTAVTPGDPIGVDILSDEIAFYPVLYWPVRADLQPLPEAAVAKIDAYMKKGGMIIFDTQDFGTNVPSGFSAPGQDTTSLQRLLGRLDLPRLEPVPDGHVLSKSFYLLRSFPGRWDGGQLWVEAGSTEPENGRRARRADGVTSIMITSNDFAAAWAIDERGRPFYPTVPGGELQREMAFRTGINIVMHALTGNYKADQVHVPALLERLGQ